MRMVKLLVCVILGTLAVEGVSCEGCEPLYNAIVKHKEVIIAQAGWNVPGYMTIPDSFRVEGLKNLKEKSGVDFDNNEDLKQYICRLTDAGDVMGLATIFGIREQEIVDNNNFISDQLQNFVNNAVYTSVTLGWYIGIGIPNFPLGIPYEKLVSSYRKLRETRGQRQLSEEQLAEMIKGLSDSQSLTEFEKSEGFGQTVRYMEVLESNVKAWPRTIMAFLEVTTAARESGMFDIPLRQQDTDQIEQY